MTHKYLAAKIRSNVLPVFLTMCSVYFLFLAVTLRTAKCADAQCAIVPHFYQIPTNTLDTFGSSNGVVMQPLPGYNKNNSFCGLTYVDLYNVNDGGIAECRVYDDSGHWKLRAYLNDPNNTGPIRCGFSCVAWQSL